MSVIQFLAEWALRSSILILTGGVVLKGMRIKDASIRLAAWTAMLLGSLAIPVIGATIPRLPLRIVRPAVAPIAALLPSDEIVAPTTPTAPGNVRAAQPGPAPFDRARAALVLALTLYAAVALALLTRIMIGLALCRRLLRTSRLTREFGIRESDRITTPATVGILNPQILLPGDWSEWDAARRSAVVAHERSHSLRHDPAVQLVSAIHRALLWFSPLGWFLHSRIVRVAEEASDDAAVSATGDRAAYAELLLDFVRRANPQSILAGVPMARYGSPIQRIHRILDAKSLSRGVNRWSLAMILVLGIPITCLTASVRPQSIPLPNVPVPVLSAPTAVIVDPPAARPQILTQVTAPAPKPQSVAVDRRPRFDVASIRPCDPNAVELGGRGGKTGGATTRYRRNCVTVMTLIENAYVRFADGKNRSPMLTPLTKIEGGPGWLNSDEYTIEAEAEGNFPPMTMDGPMIQTLLEDRFQLKIHREMRDGPVYALTLAKGGPKIQPAKQGPCLESDFVELRFHFWRHLPKWRT